jgi:5-methylcytosine-specific restriction endonuclease McrA
MIKLRCKKCGNSFLAHPYRAKTAIYCSTNCFATRGISNKTRMKMSLAKRGKKPWNKGINMWADKEHPRGTLGMKFNKRRKISEETREKLRKSHYGLKYPSICGSKHPNWKGGITPKNEAIRKSAEFRNWRRKVFERDNYTCQICSKHGGYLHADHIKPFSLYPELRFKIKNGRTLCKACHYQTNTFGNKVVKYANAV